MRSHPQVSSQTDVAGVPAQDRNNLIYVPVGSAILRLEDSYSRFKDEIDGIYLQLASTTDVVRRPTWCAASSMPRTATPTTSR